MARADLSLVFEPADLQAQLLADRQQIVQRQRHPAVAALCSAARSMSGKSLCRVSCQTRISNCANCLPVVAVWPSSSGSAILQQVVGEQEPRLERHRRQSAARGRLRLGRELGVLIQEPARRLAEDSRQHPSMSSEGMRWPVSIMLRYETDGAPAASICTQRADSSSSVRPLRLRSDRSLAPRKWPCRTRCTHVCEIHIVKFLM